MMIGDALVLLSDYHLELISTRPGKGVRGDIWDENSSRTIIFLCDEVMRKVQEWTHEYRSKYLAENVEKYTQI